MPRLSKRQQREQEELDALAGPSKLNNEPQHEVESEEEQVILGSSRASRHAVGFTALVGEGEEAAADLVSDADEAMPVAKSKKSKRKKKGVGTSDHVPQALSAKPTKSKSKRKESGKSNGKSKTKEDDFDKALAELSGKYSNAQGAVSKTTLAHDSSLDTFTSLIGVSLKNLDPEMELRRFFGSKVISSSAPVHSRMSRTRSHLVRPQPGWAPANYRAGLSMRALTPDEVHNKGSGVGSSGERWWTVDASPRYKGVTSEFMRCVMSGDPQMFFDIMYEMPWHADTLLQTAEVFRHREEHATAADLLSRALFAYERAFSGSFNLTAGIHRLDFDRVENRVFYLALARNVVDLNRRGTPRTAFEFARLLFALDPHTDPHGALLHLDCLALKAGQASWLLDVWDACVGMGADVTGDGETRFDVTMMPGWIWARALALFEKEGEADQEHQASTQALKDAILAFPSIAPLLADKVDIVIPADIRQTDAFKVVVDYSPYRDDLPTSLIHLLSHIYVARSFSLWKPPARGGWLRTTLCSFSPAAFSAPRPRPHMRLTSLLFSPSNLTDAIYRHINVIGSLVPDFRRLSAFFPTDVKDRMDRTIEGDPLPPVTAVSAYGERYFVEAAVEHGAGRDVMARRIAEDLQRAFADPADRRQFQALFDAHPEVAARFPGGMAEFARLARQFPEEVMEALLRMVAMGGDERAEAEVGVEERMPGGENVLAESMETREELVDAHESEEEDQEEEEEEEDETFFPVRIVQNLLGRLWRRRAEGDSDEDVREEEGVGAGGAVNAD